jgi:Lysozyme inhibitor LprI
MLTKYRYLFLVAVGVMLAWGIYPTSPVIASQAGKEYNLAEEKLSQTYQALVKKIRDPNQKRKIISAQTAWLNARNADAKFFGAYYQNSKGGLFYKTKLTKDRTEYLQAIIDRPPTSDGDNFGPEKYTE